MSSKFAPPKFIDNASEYAEYKRKLERWSRITKVEKKQQAEVILYHLEGHPSGIQSKIDTALGSDIIDKEDGMKKLIGYLDEIYAEDEMTDALTKYKNFTSLQKKNDQSITEFIAEYEKTYIKAKESGCDFSDTVLAFNLLEASRLSDTDEKFILTAIDFKLGKEKKDLFEQVKNSLRKFQSRDKLCSDSCESRMAVKKEESLIAGVKEALVAEGWKPPSKPVNSGNSGYQGKKNFLTSGGKPARCYRCNSEYHLISKCPMPVEKEKESRDDVRKKPFNKKKGKESTERTMLSKLLDNSRCNQNLTMVCQVLDEEESEDGEECARKDDDEEVVLIEENETELCLLIAEAGCRGLLDSACSKSVAGIEWTKNYTKNISSLLVDKLELTPSTKVYQFGGGEKRKSHGCVQLPTVIGDKKVYISMDIVDASIPLLIGSNSMERGKAILNFHDKKATFFDEEVEMIKIGTGHFCIDLVSENLETHINDVSERDQIVERVLIAADQIDVKGLKKLHHLYGHTSAEKLLRFLHKAGKDTSTIKDQLVTIEKSCESCMKSKRRKPRPKSAIPRVDKPNEIVTLDLKQCDEKFGKINKYICYMIDMHSRLTMADFIPDKKPESIVECVMGHWVSVFGVMEGIHSDIGGEMSNGIMEDVAHKLGVKLTTTSSYSPHQNGLNERNHAIVDLMITRMMASDKNLSPEMALRWSLNAKNSLDNCHGFSPFQLHIGRNPVLPSVTRDGPPSFENETKSESFAAHLNAMNTARQEFVKAESSSTLKKALKSRIYPRGEDIVEGDWIYYNKRDGKGKNMVWDGPVKVTSVNGKKLFIDQGARLGTVNRDDSVKVGEEFWKVEELEESEAEDVASKQVTEGEHKDDVSSESESEDEEVESDSESEDEEVENDEHGNSDAEEEEEEEGRQEHEEDLQNNKQIEEAHNNEVREGQDDEEQEDENKETQGEEEEEGEPEFSYENIKVGVVIRYTIPESKVIETSKVVSRAGKSNGGNRFWWNVQVQETGEEKSVNMARMKHMQKVREICEEEQIDTLFVSIPRYMHKEPECVIAKEKELQNWEDFGVYVEVEDEGQEVLNTNWVLVKKEGTVKARLCVRGDQEHNREEIKTDSPTVNKVNVKLFYVLAACFGWSIRSADVRAAFLQGADLDRDVYLRPPKERRVPGVLWKMVKRVYGLVDASRGFYLELNKVLLELGCKVSSFDPAMYMYYLSDGSLGGMVLTHVDDLIHGSGDEEFYNTVMKPLKERFQFGREEEGDFKYIGLHVRQEIDSIITDQDQYVDGLEVPTLTGYDDSNDYDLLTEDDQREFRTAVGRIGWVANTSRPDLAYDHLVLSTKLGKATVRDMKQSIKVMRKLKVGGTSMRFVKLGPIEQWSLVSHGDAGYKSLPDKMSSCGGHVILLCNERKGVSCVVNWRSKKLRRVVSSSTAGEALAVNDALDELVYVKLVLMELLGVKAQKIPMRLATDSRNLYKAVHNSTLVPNPRLRTEIAKVKDSLRNEELNELYLVSGKEMLADVLTKKGAPGFRLMNVLHTCGL